jgi:hypothetical protein
MRTLVEENTGSFVTVSVEAGSLTVSVKVYTPPAVSCPPRSTSEEVFTALPRFAAAVS